jgi:cysteinyl-tRNA synthetase
MPVPVKKSILSTAVGVFTHFSRVLGVFQYDPDVFFETDRALEVAKRGLDSRKIEALILERRKAREDKDWQRADEIRKELAVQGITLKDSPTTTNWSVE